MFLPAPGLCQLLACCRRVSSIITGAPFRRLLRGIEVESLNEGWQALREQGEVQLENGGRAGAQADPAPRQPALSWHLTLP